VRSQSKIPNLDSVTSINEDGSRFVIHPADVMGRYTRWRRIAALFLIGVYMLLPWIPVNGYPAVFLDVIERRFHLFGFTLAAQDLWLLFFLVSGLAFFLFYITTFLGRVWCGWACPQTVFLEHVFRRVERWIEGDSAARKKLDSAPLSGGKVFKRGLKLGIYLILSAGIAHMFLAYFISIPQLWEWIHESPFEHWKPFVFVVASTVAIFLNFTWFREQLCIVICPYGRFQSVLVDDESLNIAYDYERGNPPGHAKDESAGDCIDCRRCIQVCPTGIDIRNGLQLECIGCAACVDACDEIMDKVKRPHGLIRYASDRNLEGFKSKFLRPRTVLYTALLFLGITVAGFSFSTIEPVVGMTTRMPGVPFYITDTHIRNQYQIRLINKDSKPLAFSVFVQANGLTMPLEATGVEPGTVFQPMEERNVTYVVRVPRESFTGAFPLEILIMAEPGGTQITQEVEFLGPDPELLNRKTP
jgi:cytochrome c oxidase accessory protein FixG